MEEAAAKELKNLNIDTTLLKNFNILSINKVGREQVQQGRVY